MLTAQATNPPPRTMSVVPRLRIVGEPIPSEPLSRRPRKGVPMDVTVSMATKSHHCHVPLSGGGHILFSGLMTLMVTARIASRSATRIEANR